MEKIVQEELFKRKKTPVIMISRNDNGLYFIIDYLENERLKSIGKEIDNENIIGNVGSEKC